MIMTDKMLFAKNEVVRLMKENIGEDKMISERVKVEMNVFLSCILKEVCAELDKYPYTVLDYSMLKECIAPYVDKDKLRAERERLVKHLEAIESDCRLMKLDLENTLGDDIDAEDVRSNQTE